MKILYCPFFLEYQKPEGLESLLQTRFRVTESDMAAHAEPLLAYFQEHPPASCKEAAALVKSSLVLNVVKTVCVFFLKNLGLMPKNSGSSRKS